jgi:hypothetical protein
MVAPLTQFQKKMAARRGTSSIDKLSRQYQEQIKNITGEYETSFSEYQKKREETMAPYNTAVEKYKADYGTFESSMADYKKRFGDYQAAVEDVQKNPYEAVTGAKFFKLGNDGRRDVHIIMIPGDKKQYSDNPEDTGAYIEKFGYKLNGTNISKLRSSPAAFTEKAPTGPTAPEAPVIEEFDAQPFEEKKTVAEQTFNREKDERKAARLGAVSRKGTRPLLAGTKA